jgi:hypothetical protein
VCDIWELIFVCFGLLVREKSVGVGITMVCKIILQKRLLVHKHSTDAKTQFAILYRPLRTICSRPLSLHDRSDHLCRDSSAKGWYFESANRGEGLAHTPIFGAYSLQSCDSSSRAAPHDSMRELVWRDPAYIVAVLPCYYTHIVQLEVVRGIVDEQSHSLIANCCSVLYNLYTTW